MKGIVDFTAAVLKGIVEHTDPTAYFGSTSAMRYWKTAARAQGWIDEEGRATEKGKRHYRQSGLSDFPKNRDRRAYEWDWSRYVKDPR